MFEFLAHVFEAIGMALRLDRNTFDVMLTWWQPNLVLAALVILCGASLLLGQSVILFLNQVPPQRFVLSLFLNGVLFGAGLLIWAATIWLVATLWFDYTPPRGSVIWIICLSSAPYIFGFLMLIPWAGVAIGRLLSAWSFLIAIVGVELVYGVRLWQAVLCVLLGWLAMQLAQATIGRPIVRLRDWLWAKVVGEQKYGRASDILEAFMSDKPLSEAVLREGRR
jgi:hypothetical protein